MREITIGVTSQEPNLRYFLVPTPWFDEVSAAEAGYRDSDCVTAVSVSKESRFGNAVQQIRNAVSVARENHLPTVYLPGFWWIKKGIHQLSCGIRLVNEEEVVLDDEEVLLVGRFFNVSTLVDFPPGGLSCRQVIDHLGDLVILDRDGEVLADDHLVIHLRAGDIFTPWGVHPGYGQPPLAFYLRVLESGSWRRVTLVAQDTSNPIWELLAERASSRGECDIRIGGSLRKDLEFLLRARSLVVASGTFARGIAAVSKSLEHVHSFEGSFDPWGNDKVKVTRWVDSEGSYRKRLLSQNWVNSPDQRELMITYPMEFIRPAEG